MVREKHFFSYYWNIWSNDTKERGKKRASCQNYGYYRNLLTRLLEAALGKYHIPEGPNPFFFTIQTHKMCSEE